MEVAVQMLVDQELVGNHYYKIKRFADHLFPAPHDFRGFLPKSLKNIKY